MLGSNAQVRLTTVWTDAAFDYVWAAVGVHPHDAADADDATLAGIEGLATDPRVVAVGDDVCTTDTLPVEACGRSPDAGGVEARRQLVVDRVRHVLDGRSGLERKRLVIHIPSVA